MTIYNTRISKLQNKITNLKLKESKKQKKGIDQ